MAPSNTREVLIQPGSNSSTHSSSTSTPDRTSGDSWLTTPLTNFNLINHRLWDEFNRNFATNSIFSIDGWSFGSTFPHTSLQEKRVKIDNGKENFQIVFDTDGFEKEDLKVVTVGQTLKIEGKHEEKSDNGRTYVSKQFSRAYILPNECTVENMTSHLSNDKLTIVVPKRNLAVENTTRQIPIVESRVKNESNKKYNTPVMRENTQSATRQVPIAHTGLIHDSVKTNSTSMRNEESLTAARNTVSFNNAKDLNQHKKHSTDIKGKTTEVPVTKATKTSEGFLQNTDWIIPVPQWFRPIQLFDQDDSFFDSAYFSTLRDSFFNDVESSTKSNQFNHAVNTQEDDKEFGFTFELTDFKPEELKVSVLDNVLKVEGLHEETLSDGKKATSHHFVRSYAFPKEYQVDKVQSNLTKSGQLSVKIPKEKPSPLETQAREITIKMV